MYLRDYTEELIRTTGTINDLVEECSYLKQRGDTRGDLAPQRRRLNSLIERRNQLCDGLFGEPPTTGASVRSTSVVGHMLPLD